jgi:hypothetical protein
LLPVRRFRALRTICGSWSRRKGTLAAPANLAVTESHSWYFFGSCAIDQSRDIRRQCRGRTGRKLTLRTGLEVAVAATAGGPWRRRWWRRSAVWWWWYGAAARGLRSSAARRDDDGERAREEPDAAADAEARARGRGGAGRSGRRRVGTDGDDDMAGGGGGDDVVGWIGGCGRAGGETLREQASEVAGRWCWM